MRAGRRSSGIADSPSPFPPPPPVMHAPFACSLGPEPPSNQLLGQSRRGVLDTGGTMPPGLAHAFPLALSQPLAFSGHPPYPLCLVRLVYPPTKPEADIRQSLVPPPTLSPRSAWHCSPSGGIVPTDCRSRKPQNPLGRAPACRLLDPCGSSGSVALAIPQE